jgi:hypothetical protein
VERDENRSGLAFSGMERPDERDPIHPVPASGKEGTWFADEVNIFEQDEER